MTYKEMNAVVMIVTGAATAAWVLWQGRTNPVAELDSVAWRLLYAVGFNIIVNIVVMILATIVVSIARREELKDERADERDRAIADKSMRNAYFAVSVGGLTVIIMMALGFGPVAAAYSLFSALTVGGLIDPISRLVYYRIG